MSEGRRSEPWPIGKPREFVCLRCGTRYEWDGHSPGVIACPRPGCQDAWFAEQAARALALDKERVRLEIERERALADWKPKTYE